MLGKRVNPLIVMLFSAVLLLSTETLWFVKKASAECPQPPPERPAQCDNNRVLISMTEAAQYALAAKFEANQGNMGSDAATIVAIAWAETEIPGTLRNIFTCNYNPPVEVSLGILQLDICNHPTVADDLDANAFDPRGAFEWAKKNLVCGDPNQCTNFGHWTEFRNEGYLEYLDDARQAVAEAMSEPRVVFNDNMENGINGWTADGSWTQTTVHSASPSHSWTDSPDGNYENGANTSLLSPIINLAEYTSATLTFWHRYDLEWGADFGKVWVTTDGGSTYTQLASFTGTQETWGQSTIDLMDFVGQPSVQFIFQVTSDHSRTGDGWYIDDVAVLPGQTTLPWPAGSSRANISQWYAEYNSDTNGGAGGHHTGLDIVSDNPYVVAVHSGTVRRVDNFTYDNANHCMGNVVIIDDDNRAYSSLYAHLGSILVSNNQQIETGATIGVIGNTGSEGARCSPFPAHLHFELKSWGVLGSLDDDLGPVWGYSRPDMQAANRPNWYGYINPYPYLEYSINDINPIAIMITEASAPIRSGPDPSYTQQIGTVPGGHKFVAFSEYNGWYQVYLASNDGPATGWVQGVVDESAATGLGIQDRERGISGVSVRINPSTTSGIITSIWDRQGFVQSKEAPSGEGCNQPWREIYLPDGLSSSYGWVCGEYVRTSSCFVATAAFGTPMAKEILILREFRDTYLATNKLGQLFVSFYYQYSPYWADIIRANQTLQSMTRVSLIPIIQGSKFWLKSTTDQKYILIIAACQIFLLLVLIPSALTNSKSKVKENSQTKR